MSHAAKLRQSLDASPGLSPANVDEVRPPGHSTSFMPGYLVQQIVEICVQIKSASESRCECA